MGTQTEIQTAETQTSQSQAAESLLSLFGSETQETSETQRPETQTSQFQEAQTCETQTSQSQAAESVPKPEKEPKEHVAQVPSLVQRQRAGGLLKTVNEAVKKPAPKNGTAGNGVADRTANNGSSAPSPQ